jgi:hypothetical protein
MSLITCFMKSVASASLQTWVVAPNSIQATCKSDSNMSTLSIVELEGVVLPL